MKLQRIIALLASIAATATMTLVSAQPSLADTYGWGPWLIQNVDSQLCLSLNTQQGFDKDIQVVQEPCNSAPWQQWYLKSVGGISIYHIVNKANGMCLRAVSNQDFAVVDTTDCTSITNELWFINGGQFISRISSGGVPRLDVYEDSSALGTPLDVFHADGSGAQQFNVLTP